MKGLLSAMVLAFSFLLLGCDSGRDESPYTEILRQAQDGLVAGSLGSLGMTCVRPSR